MLPPLRALPICLLVASAALGQEKVAVLPIAARAGALSASEASALTAALRSAAREALEPRFEVVAVDGADPAAALQEGAAAVVLGRAASIEGATVISMGVYKTAGAPAAQARVVGIGLDQLEADLRARVPRLLTGALGMTEPAAPATPRPGRLRIPGGQPASQPAPQPPPQTQTPAVIRKRPPPPRNEDPLVRLIRETTEDVEDLRGLRRKHNLEVEILDDKLFAAAVREKAKKELTPAVVAAERARWLAFNLAPAAADPAQVLLDVLDEQVAGFYDPFTGQLIVRRNPPESAGAALGPDGLRIILAHEIEHALQDQNFGIPDLATLPDDDVRLARSALFEGDAMAVMTAYGALRAHKPIKAAIVGGAAMLRSVDTDTLLRISGKSPALLHSPPVLREELVVPYSAGFALVAEAYRRGGFALVDRMFTRPPESLHQVLHPEAYFAGELPAPIAAPLPPPGTRVISRGRMGELGTRIALETCVDKAVVKDLSAHWAGDAYTVVEGPKNSISLLWTTVWSGGTAANVGNVIRLVQPCWEDQGASARGPSGWTITRASKVGASGSLVAVVRGGIGLDAALARQLAAAAPVPAPAPPLGEVPAPLPAEPARVEGNRFVSPRLGLEGELPEGFTADSGNPAAEMAISRKGPPSGSAALSFMPVSLAGEAVDTFFQTASGQFAATRGAHLTFVRKSSIKLAGATGEERSWTLDEGGGELRIALAPWCGGHASLALVRVDAAGAASAALDSFAASLRPDGVAAACTDLE
jgi:hypothetical protein